MHATVHYKRFGFDLSAILLMLMMACFVLALPKPAFSQIVRTVKAELTDDVRSTFIGPQIYISRDNSGNLNYNTIITRHLNNLRGQRQNEDIISLAAGEGAVWMIFTVENNSSVTDWVLDFGTLSQGRYALVNKIMIRNDTTQQTVLSALGRTDRLHMDELHGSSLPLSLPTGQSSTIVIYLQMEDALPHTIAPRLVREGDFWGDLRTGSIFNNVAALFFTGMIGFFLALSYLKRNYSYLLFAGYYTLNGFLLLCLDRLFFVSSGSGGELLIAVFHLILIAAIYMSQFFLELEEDHDRERYALHGAAGFLAAGAILSIIDFGPVFNGLLTVLPAFCALFVIIFLSFLQTHRGHMGAPHYATSWLPVLIGLNISCLAAANILSPGVISMNAYWISLLPQAAFIVMGTIKRAEMMEDREHKIQVREAQEAQTLLKLKQTKENADQARLLRVIEREREVLADLRDKEIRRTEEMRIAMERADEANRAKSAFLAVVSHEIRTPMTGIMGMVKLMLNTKLSSEQKDYILAVQKSGDTMMALLNDILDFEKIETGGMELEIIDFDLHKLIAGIVTLMSGQAQDKDIFLKADIPADVPRYVRGDPTRLRQVILNLVNNAIKFTEDGGVIIHIRASELTEKVGQSAADCEVYFAVEDTGIGIAEEVQDHLFSPFSQADKSTTRKYGGTGLGLAICKKIIEAMGSSIRVSSEVGSGSTFFFTLLMEQGQAHMAEDLREAGGAKDYQTDPLSILVAEDNEMNRRVLTGLLEKYGHIVKTVSSGGEALAAIEQNHYDLVISDINMGEMSGMELTGKIRRMDDHRKAAVPVIALTGNVRPEDIEEFYRANMNGFLAKPIDPDKLMKTIYQASKGELANPVQLADGRDLPPPPPQPAAEERFAYASENGDIIAFAEPDGHEDDAADEDALSSQDFDSFDMSLYEPRKHAERGNGGIHDIDPASNALFDMPLLGQLLDSLGAKQFKSLMSDYIEHADRIVALLEDQAQARDMDEIKARAHELKGMAANFGIKSVGDVAGRIEKACGAGEHGKALQELQGIFDIHNAANKALKDWIEAKL